MIATPLGWTTLAELKVGDAVFDEAGQPCQVLAKSEVFLDHDCFEVVFDDGERIIADAEHRWWTFTSADRDALLKRSAAFRMRRRQERPSRGTGKRPDVTLKNQLQAEKYEPQPVLGAIRTTREIAATVRVRQGARVNHSVRLAGPLQLPEVELPVPPYTFGAWLGDGNSRYGRLYVAEPDEATLEWVKKDGYTVRKIPSDKVGWCIPGLAKDLRRAGVLENKHIPTAYLRASSDQRLELMRGLMDTDGCCDSDGGAEFTSCKEVLARGVLELARSLGIKATLTEGRATIQGRNCGPKYRVKMTTDVLIFHLARKAARQKSELRPTQRHRFIVECNPVPSVPVQCIAVNSPSHLYLIGQSFVPTHNSDALLMAALQYVDVPGYAALLLRRTYADLSLPGALMDRAGDWLRPTAARWRETDKTWEFPSGATLTFGYLENEASKYRYQGAELVFCGFDELSQFPESAYRYLFSRLRRLQGSDVPIRMRGATNPGSEWVKDRFPIMASQMQRVTTDPVTGRVFVPSLLADNPHLDADEYTQSLNELDPVTRAQLLEGNWEVRAEGALFKREWFGIVDAAPAIGQRVRFWDMASTHTGDWSVGCKMVRSGGVYTIEDVVRGRWTPHERDAVILQTTQMDGHAVKVVVEQEPGSAGVSVVAAMVQMLAGYPVEGRRSTGDKVTRAAPLASQAQAGNVKLVSGGYVAQFLDEMSAFPSVGVHDDVVDASSGAFAVLAQAAENPLAGMVVSTSARGWQPRSGAGARR